MGRSWRIGKKSKQAVRVRHLREESRQLVRQRTTLFGWGHPYRELSTERAAWPQIWHVISILRPRAVSKRALNGEHWHLATVPSGL